MNITYEQLKASIEQVANAERITKKRLGELSRDILSFVVTTEDVRPVNMLLGTDENDSYILTPVNWRIAVQYFAHFLPFSSNYQDVKDFAIRGSGQRQPLVFGKKSKRKWESKVDEINNWLADEGNDIWVWSDNATVEAKPIDYAKQVTNAVKKAMAEDKGGMSLRDVFNAMMEADVDINEMFIALDGMVDEAAPEEQAA